MFDTPPQAAALWSALLLILMVVLAFRVIRQRQKNSVLIGDGGKESLILAGRTFGNAAEYIPAGIAAMALLCAFQTSFWTIHLIGGLLFIGRLLHAGSLSATKLTITRMAGMCLTFAAYIVAAGALLLHAF